MKNTILTLLNIFSSTPIDTKWIYKSLLLVFWGFTVIKITKYGLIDAFKKNGIGNSILFKHARNRILAYIISFILLWAAGVGLIFMIVLAYSGDIDSVIFTSLIYSSYLIYKFPFLIKSNNN